MKQMFSICIALILVSSSLNTVFAKTTSSTSELQKLLNEGYTEITFQNGTFNGGFTVQDNETPEEAEKRFYEEHNKFLSIQTKKLQASLWSRSADKEERTINMELLKDIQNAKNSEIIFSPSSSKEDHNTYIENKKVTENNHESFLRSANTPWAPYKGAFEINQSYVQNEFYFNNIGAFNSNRTYEHETQVYDTNYADYAGYWNSNLPNAYYDTPFWDEDVDIFTVGSSDTQDIKANTKYTTYMSLKPGTTSTALVIVKGQIGHRNPNWCHSTWCIWADATSSGLVRVNAPFLGISWVR